MSQYLLKSDEELARLQLQARVWEPEAEAMLDKIGVRRGWSAIDLGCGAMGILGPLKKRVGPNGRVVGVEADNELLQAAQQYGQAAEIGEVELINGDATNTGLPSATFDLVHTRFLFPHVEPKVLLNEMMRLAKPRAIIAAQEPDHSSWNFYPPCEEWPELLKLLEKALAMRGDINIGRRMYTLFQEAGLNDVSVRAGVVALQNSHPYMKMPLVAAQAMKAPMVASGLVKEERLDQLIKAVAACAEDPARMQLTFTVVQVWGQKPLE